MLDTYIKAKEAYSDNNLLELYMICVNLNIDVELEGEDVENIMEVILLKTKRDVGLRDVIFMVVGTCSDTRNKR